ncbi:hypothetical protein CHU00_18555 [Sphingobacterium cellulitidis]|uniref:eCIS core domain-containing protein n=1 Tax=Sphingobacterium cellulitidis TaxID=1768011 RepID=UPI000B93D3E3|nr:DUF4157 domain-containing protein [Sphingobacterium cellulitidis]OYD44125.1 hypothetical protein CHU00_18555 [Sphingobacterium cellulitidis]
MKAAEVKSVASPAKSRTPFFSKGGDSSFFSDSPTHAAFFQRKQESNAFFVQTKLNVGSANDHYEKEADTTADRVVQKMEEKRNDKQGSESIGSSISPLVQKKCDSCEKEEKVQRKTQEHENVRLKEEEEDKTLRNTNKVGRKELRNQSMVQEGQSTVPVEDNRRQASKIRLRIRRVLRNQQIQQQELQNLQHRNVSHETKPLQPEKEDTVQRKVNSSASSIFSNNQSIEQRLANSRNSGRPLPDHILKQMESSFGVDFSKVRIHDHSNAVQMSKELNAQAFAYGNDIYFNTGKFDFNSPAGRHLLAHELTHTLQQTGVQPKQVQQKKAAAVGASANKVNQAAPGIGISSTDKKIAKQDEEDGFLLSQAKEAIWDLLREASPEIYDIFRNKGFLTWAKEKVSAFVNATIDTFAAPIRLGASIIAMVRSNFAMFKVWLVTAIERLKQGDCTPFVEATDFIQKILEGVADPALEKLKEFLAPIKSFIDFVWNDIGKPVWDFVSRIFGKIWDSIKWVADKIWNHIKTVIDFYADLWHWFAQAIGFEGDDQNSLWEQVKSKILSLWEEVKQKLEPYKTKLMVLGGIILMLSPAGPFIIAGATLTGIIYAASQIRRYLIDRDAIIKERGLFQGVIIPQLNAAILTISNFLKAKVAVISSALITAVATLQSIPRDMSSLFLSAINSAVNWITEKVEEMEAWANIQLNNLINSIESAFTRIKAFLQPIFNVLTKVGEAITDYLKLAFLILDDWFHRIPKCIRDKIIAFFVKYVFKYIPLLKDIKDVEGAWATMQKKTMHILEMMFVHGDVMGALWEVFNLLLEALKFPKDLAVKVFNKAFEVFDTIIEKPKVFFVNMLTTVKLGFLGFFERKWTHLKDGFTTWLFDAAKDSPIYIPQAFSFSEIFKMLGSIFSFGMEKVYKSIEKKRGKEVSDKVKKWVGRISRGAAKVWEWIVALHEHSLDEIIQMIKDKGAELLQTFIDSAIDWLVSNIINKVSEKLISMLDPSGVMAVVNSIVAFYNAVETAIEKAKEILELVENVLDNVADVMAGTFANAALKFENNLKNALPLIMEFLANQVLSSKIGKKLKEIAEKANKWIDEKVDWLVDKLLAAGDWLVEKGEEVVEAFKDWWTVKKQFVADDGTDHEIYFKGKEENAELMIASKNPKRFENFINQFKFKDDPEKEKAKESAIPIAQEIDKLKSTYAKPGLSKEERNLFYMHRRIRTEELTSNLAVFAAKLISEKELADGSYENPIPIRWTKLGHMKVISNLVPNADKWTQKNVAVPKNIETVEFNKKTILELPPTTRKPFTEIDRSNNTDLGKTYVLLGISTENVPKLGKKLQRTKTKDNNGEKDRVRYLLKTNYNLKLGGEDIDHVKDLGFGGKDQISNLWPLERGLNQQIANHVYKQKVVYKKEDGNPTISTPNELNSKWFIIKEIGYF